MSTLLKVCVFVVAMGGVCVAECTSTSDQQRGKDQLDQQIGKDLLEQLDQQRGKDLLEQLDNIELPRNKFPSTESDEKGKHIIKIQLWQSQVENKHYSTVSGLI